MSTKAITTAAVAGLSMLDGAAWAAPAPLPSWTGYYIGVGVGANWQDVGYGHPTYNGDVNVSGFNAGVFTGYNFQVAQLWVLGLEGGFSFSGNDQTNLIGGSELRTNTPWQFTFVGRVGYLITPQNMVYFAGGFASSRHEISFPSLSESFNRNGWVVGGGVETGDVVRGVHFRLEYTYSDFGTKTFFGDLPVALTQHMLRLAISTPPIK